MTTTSVPVAWDPAHCAARRDRLRARLADEGLDGYLVTRLVNVRYLSGFTGSNGTLLVTPDGDTFATDGRYEEQAAGEVPDLPVVIGHEQAWLPERFATGARLAVESHDLTWERAATLDERLATVELVRAPRWVEELRTRKDDAELAALRRACALADEAFGAMLAWVAPGVSEREVADYLEAELRARGAQGPAFDTIVASGPNSARPHHRPGPRPLERGDLLKVDFGALVDGYHSDMTRTVALGEPAPELRRAHALVLEAQAAGRAAVAPGVSAAEVDRACRDRIAADGLADRFVHPTGHGVGLEIHEEPILHADATATLRARMAVTVEPGVYLPGRGGVRIEDTVVVPDEPGHAADVLTRTPRELLVL